MLGLRLFIGIAFFVAPAVRAADVTPDDEKPFLLEKVPVVQASKDVMLGPVSQRLEDEIRAISPRGDVAIVGRWRATVNLWHLVLAYWKIWLGALAGIALLHGLWRTRRLLRQQRLRGGPTCRQCNYDLTGATGRNCPECGTTIAGRSPSARRRLTRIALVALPLPILYVWCWFGPRFNGMEEWFDWTSDNLMAAVDPGDAGWLKPGVVWRVDAVELNLHSGLRGEVIHSFKTYIVAAHSPDQTRLFLTDAQREGIEWDWSTRQITSQLTLPRSPIGAYNLSNGVIDKRAAYVGPSRVLSNDLGVVEWNLTDGVARNVSADRLANYDAYLARRKAAAGSEDSIRFGPEEDELEAGIFAESILQRNRGGSAEFLVTSRDGYEQRTLSTQARFDGNAWSRSPDGRLVWCIVNLNQKDWLEAWGIQSGERIRRIPLPLTADALTTWNNRLIITCGLESRVLIIDPRTEHWVASLAVPDGSVIHHAAGAADGSIVVIIDEAPATGANTRALHFDLRSLLGDE